jgi:hypothetical protein
MTLFSKTSIVYNKENKLLNLPMFYYRYRRCDTNLNGNTPADQYQKLKLIQNTVRVYSSLYTSNVASLNTYQQPGIKTNGVCWNQMSDRVYPSVQKASIPTGNNNSLNKRHTSVTSSKPGSQTPGGIGCDIKHNSYDRYLNRLKGKGPLRRGIIPTGFGEPIPFNNAYPIYGGKTTKTNIVSGCNCPIKKSLEQNISIYNNPYWEPEEVGGKFTFKIGDYVYAIETGNTYYSRAIILNIINSIYTIEFDNGTIQTIASMSELLVYYPCNCNETINNIIYPSGFLELSES